MNATDLCRRYVDAWNSHDAEAILGCFALDGRYEDPITGGPISGAQLKAHAQRLWRAFPDLAFEAETPIASPPDRVAVGWTMSGTNLGRYLGATQTGGRVSMRGMALLRCAPEGIAAATATSIPLSCRGNSASRWSCSLRGSARSSAARAA